MAFFGTVLRVLRCVREVLERVSGAYAREWRGHGHADDDQWEGT